MGKEKDDIEFDELLADKRHKEITGRLGKLADALNKPEKEDKAVADGLKEAARASQAIAQAIRDIPKPESPDVNVQFDHKSFVTSMDKIADRIEASINKGIEAGEKKLYVDKFKIRNMGGGTHEADVFYKPLKDVIIKK